MAKEVTNKTLLYSFDVDETYTYNAKHGTEYPYNGFPPGINRRYKKTRFIDWNPIPEDIIVRHAGSQIIVSFDLLFPNDNLDPNIGRFQMRSKRLELQNLICEQINFFTALYDPDNDLLTSMLIAKYVTDVEKYTIATFDEYYRELFDILFPESTIKKIQKMVDDNNVGDDVVGQFSPDFVRDVYIVSFMIKIMHIYIEHFIISSGNSPKDMFELSARAFTYIMENMDPDKNRIEDPKLRQERRMAMYTNLYSYVNTTVSQSVTQNSNIYDMQAINGVTGPTTTHVIMRKTLICDGLIKLTFANTWDRINKRPKESCVGLITTIVKNAAFQMRRIQLRYSLANVDDVSQLLDDDVTSSSPISLIRSFNPGEFQCMYSDLGEIIANIALDIDVSPVNYYLENLPVMNDLSKLLVKTVLYNRFHSSISIDTLTMKQKYILLLYVRSMIMKIRTLSEEDTKGDPVINILMGKVTTTATQTLTKKDMASIKKFVKINNLKTFLLNEANVDTFTENILKCVMSSYTIVNHNDPSLLNTQLHYDSNQMTLALLETVVSIFEVL
jgi:protein tyrosine phosphatase (PTP) superfamily phosphohydrolase (DUF442 family)